LIGRECEFEARQVSTSNTGELAMLNLRRGVALWLIVVAGVSSHAQGQSIEELKETGDLRGLVAKLGDRRATVRSEAAVALPGVAAKVKDPTALDPFIGQLVTLASRVLEQPRTLAVASTHRARSGQDGFRLPSN
jgi:hypothetical protein